MTQSFALFEPSGITPAQARVQTNRAKRNLRSSYADICELYDTGAWRLLRTRGGKPLYATWGEFLHGEFDDLRIVRLTSLERESLVVMCREQKMSYAKIAKQLGIAVGAAYNADPASKKNREASGYDPILTPDDETGTDTQEADVIPFPARHDAEPDIPRGGKFIDLVVAHVRATGAEGITCKRLKSDMHVGHQRMSPALSRAVDSGRLRYEAPEKRGQHGLYFATDER